MNVIRNRDFEEEEVILDHNAFDGCTFTECILIYHGHGPTDLLNNRFNDNAWRFRGPADRFLGLLQQMNNQIGMQAEVVDLVSNTIFGRSVPLRPADYDDGPHLVLDFGRISEELAAEMRGEEAEEETEAVAPANGEPETDEEDTNQ